MKCQTPFSGENKKSIINLSPAELAKRVVKFKLKGYIYDVQSFLQGSQI